MKLGAIVIGGLVAIVVLWSSFFVVNEWEQVVLTQFGQLLAAGSATFLDRLFQNLL